mmetsp:Transcript_11708/g.28752  ORF Transcript_11708/g.28752 Transcript_11708/m.28752 type:complete len:82 (-) Transcript_11708:1300-1545(-)
MQYEVAWQTAGSQLQGSQQLLTSSGLCCPDFDGSRGRAAATAAWQCMWSPAAGYGLRMQAAWQHAWCVACVYFSFCALSLN